MEVDIPGRELFPGAGIFLGTGMNEGNRALAPFSQKLIRLPAVELRSGLAGTLLRLMSSTYMMIII
jgi:hypothetical protein